MGPPLDAAALRALGRKYASLARWRHARDAGEAGPGPLALRRMAARFPGALRELDTLGQAELERRALAATRAAHALTARGRIRARPRRHAQDAEDWMPWIATVHAVLRAVLAWRRRYRRSKPRPAASAGDRLSLPSGAAFALTRRDVARLLSPPGGRTLPVVLALVARRFGVSEGLLARRLFPARRRTPAARG